MIIFANEGLAPLEAFTIFGMSAKPGSANPIGKFGTGLKYAVAVTLRLGGEFRLWRGTEEYVFYTSDKEFRGKDFQTVRMRRRSGLTARWRYEALPFTTELGKHWEPWMAVRELEANVRDEGGWSGDFETPPVGEGRTVIAVTCPEMEEAYADLGSIFLPEREKLYEDTRVVIYDGESDYMYYRGMRVRNLRKPSLFTYEVKQLWLTEDRTSMYPFIDDEKIKDSLLACPKPEIIRTVISRNKDHHEESLGWDEKKPTVSPAWRGALGGFDLSGRFKTLRDNLNYGPSSDEEVSVKLEVRDWEKVLSHLPDIAEAEKIREQLREEGWKGDEPVEEGQEA